ncbi:MAG: 4-hydroxy-3-methylbut-2-enyl diphosphate reductase [Candidatus Omnitrophota bacterium]
MVKIRKAGTVGFCFGVRRAINIAQKALNNGSNIYSLGPIIHNPLVVKELSDKGLKVISEVKDAGKGKILIRTHGIAPSVRQKIKQSKKAMIDATCPYVERLHNIVNNLKKEGFYIIIAGEKNHPEVVALSEAAGANKLIAIDEKQIKRLTLKNKKVGLLAQTTLAQPLFKKIISAVIDKEPVELRIFNTICADVLKRQSEAARLSAGTDIMLIIGGKISANTKRLAQICKSEGAKTFHVETDQEIKKSWFRNCESAGIISGSSTPSWIVDKVINKIQKNTI